MSLLGTVNSVRFTLRLLIKQLKNKERILKEARQKWLPTYKNPQYHLTANCSDFLAETIEARKWWDDIVQVLEEKKKVKSWQNSWACAQPWAYTLRPRFPRNLFKVFISQNISSPSLTTQGFLVSLFAPAFTHCIRQQRWKHLPVNVFGKYPLCPVVALALGKVWGISIRWDKARLFRKSSREPLGRSKQIVSVCLWMRFVLPASAGNVCCCFHGCHWSAELRVGRE